MSERIRCHGTHEGEVVVAAVDEVGARTADEGVVAAAAEEVGARECAVRLIEGDRIIAPLAKGLNERGVCDGRGPAHDRYGTAIDRMPQAAAAADRDGVGLRVADDREQPGEGIKTRTNRKQLPIFERF